ncbi:DUF4334 domain-containing protein [Nocardioides montaniterrae]
MTDLRARFEALRTADHVDPADLDALWADLRTVSVQEILGAWHGGDFATGHLAGKALTRLRWHGKRFDGPLDAVPMVCRDEQGELFANAEAAGGGAASLWEVGFRGETTATMVYDKLPVFDHFKAVDGDTLVGVMNGKLEQTFGVAELYWFWLERQA